MKSKVGIVCIVLGVLLLLGALLLTLFTCTYGGGSCVTVYCNKA